MPPENFDSVKSLSQCKELIRELESKLPKRIDAATLSLKSKLPFKAYTLAGVLVHRITDLGNATCQLYDLNKIVPAFIITRSIMETVAMLFWLHKRVKTVVESKTVGEIDHFLMRALFGSREISDDLPTPYNVLTAIDELVKEISSYRRAYDSLSEFLHPNFSGVHGSYAKLDMDRYWVDLGSEFAQVPLVMGLSCLWGSLGIGKHYYNELSSLLPAFVEVCDADI